MKSNYNSNDNAFYNTVAAEQEQEIRDERRRKRASRNTGAHTTMPIKDIRMVNKWIAIAKEHDEKRKRGGVSWYLLVLLGFNTAFRIGDLCVLKVSDLRGHERVRISAQKTGKESDIKLQPAVQKRIDALLKNANENDYALCSRQKGIKDGKQKPISRQRAFGIVKEIAKRAGFNEHTGCHTLRKTFAWFFLETGGDITKLQKLLNHSSQSATLHYLGLDQKAIDEVVDKMPLMM